MREQDPFANLSFELYTSARLLRRNFDRLAGAHGLSRARWQVLTVLARDEGVKQSELAERLDIAPITLTRQLDRLQEEGLVERRGDPADRRCFRVFLGKSAAPALAQLEELAQQTRSRAYAGLTAAQIDELQRALRRIRENLSNE